MNRMLRYYVASLVVVCMFGFVAAAVAGEVEGQDKVAAAKSKGLPVFVDFGKTSCAPCKMMVPVLESLTKKYSGRMEVVFVHVEEERAYAGKMGITMIPTQILLDKDGKEVSRHVGYISEEDCVKMIGDTVSATPVKTGAEDKSGNKGAAAAPGKTCAPGTPCK